MARHGISFELRGVPGLRDALARVGTDITRNVGNEAKATATAIVRQAQNRAPRDKGDLRASIAARGGGLTWRVGILDTEFPGRGGNDHAHRHPWVYGLWYELGFVSRNIRTTPFMAPAVEAEYDGHLDRIRKALSAAVE